MHAHRSLASYFDEDPRPYSTGGPASGNWYEQVEGMPQQGELGKFFKKDGKYIWVPKGKTIDQYDPKLGRAKELQRERLIKGKKQNKELAKVVKSEHEAAMRVFIANGAWDNHAYHALQYANEFIADTAAFARQQRQSMGFTPKMDKASKRRLNIDFYGLSYSPDPQKLDDMIKWAKNYLNTGPVYTAEIDNLNYPGPHSGSIHLSVFRAYVATVKRTIMDAAARKLLGQQPAYDFLLHTANAYEAMQKMEKYKDGPYTPKWRPDKQQLDAFHTRVLRTTAHTWVLSFPGKVLPRYLRKYAPKDGSYNPPPRPQRKSRPAAGELLTSDPATAMALLKQRFGIH